MPKKDLLENFEFVKQNKANLLEKYFNKYLLVYGKEVIDSYDTYEKAAGEGVRKYGTDEKFLVYHLTDPEPLNFVYSATI